MGGGRGMIIDRGYVYKAIRTPQGPRRIYLGKGQAALALAQLHEEERQVRAAVKARHDLELEREQAADREALQALAELDGAAALLFRAGMVGAGFHLTVGRNWRRR